LHLAAHLLDQPTQFLDLLLHFSQLTLPAGAPRGRGRRSERHTREWRHGFRTARFAASAFGSARPAFGPGQPLFGRPNALHRLLGASAGTVQFLAESLDLLVTPSVTPALDFLAVGTPGAFPLPLGAVPVLLGAFAFAFGTFALGPLAVRPFPHRRILAFIVAVAVLGQRRPKGQAQSSHTQHRRQAEPRQPGRPRRIHDHGHSPLKVFHRPGPAR
jgi:hypothetical protein